MNYPELKKKILESLQKRDLLGIDWGHCGAKLVRVTGQNHQKKVASWYYPEPLQEGDAASVMKFKRFLQAHQLTGLKTACNIEHGSLKIRRLDLPKMPEFDLGEAIQWQLRDVIEDPVQNYIVRHSLIEEYSLNEGVKQSLVVYAIHRAAVLEKAQFLKKLSLKPVSIEPNAVALLSALDHSQPWEKGVFCGVLDLGFEYSGFYVMKEGRLYFSRPMAEIHGKELRSFMTQELNLSDEDLSLLEKRIWGQDALQENDLEKIRTVYPRFFSKIAIEAQRSMDAFSLVFKGCRVDRLYLSGGGAAWPGLNENLTKNLGMPVAVV
ncbi:MAG: pilus assembly protein PilM, partial [bacterium]|nr:pilus assembly protein PilM [bacterium]